MLIIALTYVIQVQSTAGYIKFTEKIFGPSLKDVVKDVMGQGLFALQETNTLQDAIKMFDEEHIHSTVVLNNEEKLKGFIATKAIINLLANGKPLNFN